MATLANRNNNPGNLKDPSTGAFRQFKSPQEGYAALLNDLQAKKSATTTSGVGPSSTLADFSKVYAPASDNNNPAQYTANLANHMKVRPDTQLKDLDVGKWADAIAHSEGYSTNTYNPKPFSNPDNGASPFSINTSGPTQMPADSLSGKLMSRASDASKAIQDTSTGKINPVSGVLQTAGAVAGGVNDVVGKGLELIPGVKQAEGAISQGVGALANTPIGQKVVQAGQGFAQAHPELTSDIGAVGNIAGAMGTFAGAGSIKDVVGKGVQTALHGAEDAIAETITPKLSAKETAQAIANRGTEEKGILRKVSLKQDPQVQDMAQTIRDNVPKFDPAKGLIHNIGETQKVVTQLAKSLKNEVKTAGKDIIYPFRELERKLVDLEPPLMIASDTTLDNAYTRVRNKAIEIAKSQGGKVSNLLDARQVFDGFIRQQFPNLYSSETLTPMRQAIRDIRGAMTDFTAKHLPDVELQTKLLTQHKLLDSIENMAEKASSGATKEIGSNSISRFAGRHPVISGLVKKVPGAIIEGTGIGAGLNMLK